jgi:prepilin-type N-terminal cleavage/methylation domain-containing protein
VTGRRGFTLLEVMIAVSISAIGIVSLLELFGGSMRLARLSSEQTEAMAIASSVMDRALWRAELPEREFEDVIERESTSYRWTMVIEAVDPTFGSSEEEPLEDISDDYELYEITVQVAWGESDPPKSIVLKSLRVMERF